MLLNLKFKWIFEHVYKKTKGQLQKKPTLAGMVFKWSPDKIIFWWLPSKIARSLLEIELFSDIKNTVKLVLRGCLWDKEKVVFLRQVTS